MIESIPDTAKMSKNLTGHMPVGKIIEKILLLFSLRIKKDF